ncbi:MAG: thiamine pyrophosphate-dependent dehydrogenase E1 component subunit alpha [Anaerolineales bacterium]|nr:thiamine pyrophosphate-dependent dehydrogenase E1 component subunit alpha [Anaerolineales bacterium]
MGISEIKANQGSKAKLNKLSLYRSLYRIRRFEEVVLQEFSRGYFSGTTHTYLGQEANAVGVLTQLNKDDIVVSNHRCHGHFLAYGGDMRSLFAELMGKTTGVCGGYGGSQHLHWRNFYSNGILGGMLPVATGIALAEKFQMRQTVTIAFLGDGALGEGVFYEALNLASLFQSPILFVLENNRIAQTTPIELHTSGDILSRFLAFDIKAEQIDSSDVLEIQKIAAALIDLVRNSQSPRALIINTHRFGPHSKGDDTRPADLIRKIKQLYDPLIIHGSRLTNYQRTSIDEEVNQEVVEAFQKALEDPIPSLKEMSIKTEF